MRAIEFLDPKIVPLNPTSRSFNPRIESLIPKIESLNSLVESLNPKIGSLNPKIESLDHKVESLHPMFHPQLAGAYAFAACVELIAKMMCLEPRGNSAEFYMCL